MSWVEESESIQYSGSCFLSQLDKADNEVIMRLLTIKELNKIFSLRQSRNVKSRVRKKNHKRAMKYLDKYGLITVDQLKQTYER